MTLPSWPKSGNEPKRKKKDSVLYRKTFDSQRPKNMYILLLNKMNVLVTKGESLELEYQGLIADLENEITAKE